MTLTSSIWTFDNFEFCFEIDHESLRYLKRSCGVCSEENFSLEYIPKGAFVRKISLNYLGAAGKQGLKHTCVALLRYLLASCPNSALPFQLRIVTQSQSKPQRQAYPQSNKTLVSHEVRSGEKYCWYVWLCIFTHVCREPFEVGASPGWNESVFYCTYLHVLVVCGDQVFWHQMVAICADLRHIGYMIITHSCLQQRKCRLQMQISGKMSWINCKYERNLYFFIKRNSF